MITTLFASHTFASLPNSRLKTPIVPGPHTSCVIRMSVFTHTLSPAATRALPLARARIFSVRVIGAGTIAAATGRGKRNVLQPRRRKDLCDAHAEIDLRDFDFLIGF